MLPRLDFALQKLATEDADLDLGHIQPTRMLGCVVELHSAQELGGRAFAQHVVEALSGVDVQVVQNQVNSATGSSPIRLSRRSTLVPAAFL